MRSTIYRVSFARFWLAFDCVSVHSLGVACWRAAAVAHTYKSHRAKARRLLILSHSVTHIGESGFVFASLRMANVLMVVCVLCQSLSLARSLAHSVPRRACVYVYAYCTCVCDCVRTALTATFGRRMSVSHCFQSKFCRQNNTTRVFSFHDRTRRMKYTLLFFISVFSHSSFYIFLYCAYYFVFSLCVLKIKKNIYGIEKKTPTKKPIYPNKPK